jgi:Arc/MetJ-type ribon-helix-helix transcriptional regulator
MSKQISTILTNDEMKQVDEMINAGVALNRSDYLRNLIRADIKERNKNIKGGV